MKKPTLTAIPGGQTNPAAEKFYNDMTADVLARTIWGEARGEGVPGMEAVACVVLNRVKRANQKGGYWWGNNIIQVCQKPYQFSCWNRADPNFRKLLAVDASDLYFATAMRVANRTIAGVLKDSTGGATHYHARGTLPYWAKGETPSAEIGRHVFYNVKNES